MSKVPNDPPKHIERSESCHALRGGRNAGELAAQLDAEIRALPIRNTPCERGVLRKYSRVLKEADPEFTLDVARALMKEHSHRWLAYELIANHRAAFRRIGVVELEEFGEGIDSWGAVDSFARTLAGPAWLRG